MEIDDGASGSGRSGVFAFLLGGLTIAGGLTALLYYDTIRPGPREALTTGSLLFIQRPASSRLAG